MIDDAGHSRMNTSVRNIEQGIHAPEKTIFDMVKAHAPVVDIFPPMLHRALGQISTPALAEAFRSHRYNGTKEDRAAALAWIGQRIAPSPSTERVMITNGTMNTIMMLSSRLGGRSNNVLVEDLTFPIVYSLFEIAGVRVHRVKIDEFGIIPEDFERQCIALAPKLIYLNATIHSPTAFVMPAERRHQIAGIARKHGVLILEDEAQALYLDKAPPSFATIAPDITWYIIGMSKYLPPAFRISFTVAPSEKALENVLEKLRPVTTWHPAPLIAELATHLISTGDAQKLLDAAKTKVHARQALVQEAFRHTAGFRGSLGLHFWLEAPDGVKGGQFGAALEKAGVLVRSSPLYSGPAEPCLEGVRLTVGQLGGEDDMRRAIPIIQHVRDNLGKQAN